MSTQRLLLIAFAAALLLTSNAFASPTRPIDRLCGSDTECRQVVQLGPDPRVAFEVWQDALEYGLAWAHEEDPRREIAIAVYLREGGGYGYREAGRGEEREVTAILEPGDIALGHTHFHGRRCSTLDDQSADALPIPLFMQHTRTGIRQCGTKGLDR